MAGNAACPLCGSDHLFVAYDEHVEYSVTGVDSTGAYLDVDAEGRDQYGPTLIHVRCDACNKYWYSMYDFAEDIAKERGV